MFEGYHTHYVHPTSPLLLHFEFLAPYTSYTCCVAANTTLGPTRLACTTQTTLESGNFDRVFYVYLLGICYSIFWSDVACLSARLPRPVASLNHWGVTAKSLANTYYSSYQYCDLRTVILAVGNRFGLASEPRPSPSVRYCTRTRRVLTNSSLFDLAECSRPHKLHSARAIAERVNGGSPGFGA